MKTGKRIQKKALHLTLIALILFTSVFLSPSTVEEVNAAPTNYFKCSCQKPGYLGDHFCSTRVTTTKQKIKTQYEWAPAGQPVRNGSSKAGKIMVGTGKTSSVSWSVNGNLTYSVLKLSAGYTKTDSKTVSTGKSESVPAGWWCNLYVSHKEDVFRVTQKTERYCPRCKKVKKTTTKTYQAKVPVKRNGFAISFKKSKNKKDVTKNYITTSEILG